MSKKLEEMTFDDLVTKAGEIELESLLKGTGPIRDRMWRICELAVRWKDAQNAKEK